MPPIPVERKNDERPLLVWLQTLLTAAICGGAIVVADRTLVPFVSHRGLRIALAFGVMQTAAIVLVFLGLLVRRRLSDMRTRRSEEIAGRIQSAIAEHAAGADRLRVLRALQRNAERDVSRGVRAFLAGTRGTMHDRVAALSRDLDVAAAGFSASKSVAPVGSSSLLDRALLADELRPEAEAVAREHISRTLASGDARESIAALDLLLAWRLALPVDGLERALLHKDPEVRRRAFRVVPFALPSRAALLAGGLSDSDASVREAAASTARIIRSPELTSALEQAVADENRDVALAAAFALASLPDGTAKLQGIVDSGSRIDASVAFEALEKAALGRLESA